LPKPLRADNWERAKLVPLTARLLQGNWTRMTPDPKTVAGRFERQMPEMWTTDTAGAGITFRFKGTVAGVYDLLGPDCGQLTVKVDDQPERMVARFDGYCTYHRLSQLLFASNLKEGAHTARLTLLPDPPNKAKIIFAHNLPDLEKNPKKYEGIHWYVGAIMLIGDLH